MLNTKIKLLVIDLDHTLTDQNDQISTYNFETILCLQKKGVKVAIATGRSLESTLLISKKLKLENYHGFLICSNGALIYDLDEKKTIKVYIMPRNMIQEIINLKEVSKIFLDQDMNHFYLQKTEKIENFGNNFKEKIYPISSQELITKKIIGGFLLANNNNEIKKCVSKVKNKKINFAASFENGTQFSKTTKGKSLLWFVTKNKRKEKITSQEIIAIGDNLNDIDLLKKVGYGIAVANAKPELKKIANDITDSWNQDGVGKAIKKHIL